MYVYVVPRPFPPPPPPPHSILFCMSVCCITSRSQGDVAVDGRRSVRFMLGTYSLWGGAGWGGVVGGGGCILRAKPKL